MASADDATISGLTRQTAWLYIDTVFSRRGTLEASELASLLLNEGAPLELVAFLLARVRPGTLLAGPEALRREVRRLPAA
jgi:hypothetical protein